MGKTLADLQSNISISALNAVTGDIEWCSGYTQFSTDIGELAGWYLALQVTPDVEDATVTAAYNGTVRELDNNIFIIRLAEGEDSITFTANKEGYTEGRLTLDLSGLNKETITNYCYVTSLTNGVTVTPLQFGESKTLSGVVPYDATTSSNHFRLKYRTFIPIPNGSQISVSHFGTELGASTFSTVTPQEGDPYSEATVDITITLDILDSQSPGLSTLIIPDTEEVLDRFYCSLGVENLTLEAAPLGPLERNVFELSGSKTVDGVTYTNEDLITGGTLTRQANLNRQYVDNVHFKWNSDLLEDIWDMAGYGIILTSVDPSYAEYYSRAEAISSFRMDVGSNIGILPNTEDNIDYTIPHTYFLKFTQDYSLFYRVNYKLAANPNISGLFPIQFRNCTWEADPRPSLSISYSWLLEGNYNNIAITNYFTPSTTSLYDKVTFSNQNGYYGFLKVKGVPTDGVIRLGDGTESYIYEDVTNDITGITLASDERILKFDALSISDTQALLEVGAPGYKRYANTIFLTASWLTQTYNNGLTDRNINISPLSSTVKAAGFGDYCDINFTPVEAATATVVNDEINVTVTGTINKKSTSATIGQSLTNYLPMYKNWPNGYSSIDNKNEMFVDANKHFLIFEASTLVFPQIVNSPLWKCKGFTSTQTSLTTLYAPKILNSTSLTTIWGIPIEEGMTSVSIQAVSESYYAMTTVTYNFDLTNVTYGTISE